MTETYDYLFKLIVIGDAACGKSCLLYRFTDNRFRADSSHTIGVEFGSKIIEVGGKLIKQQIWDTAGQERFRSVTLSYYRGAAGCILVYDVTNFDHLARWLSDARSLATTSFVTVLVGNKTDLHEDRQVSYLEASRFAQENDLIFLETSAKTGEYVDEVFLKCAKQILLKVESGTIRPEDMGSGVQFSNTPNKRRQVVHSHRQEHSNNTGFIAEDHPQEPCSC